MWKVLVKIDDSTIFVGVYGTLRTHPWIDSAHLADDAYSLFAARATSMGWSSSDTKGLGPVLWGMNDAGQDWDTAATRVAWFQVGAREPKDADRPLPVQPVLACAGDTLGRVGSLELSAVSMLLPLGAGGPSVAHLVSGLNWYSTSDPAARTTVHLTLEPGEVDAIRPVTADIVAAAQRIDTGPFAVDAVLPGTRDVVPDPAVVDDLWLGVARHPVTLACSVPEWSLDAVGWLVGLVAAVCTSAGVRTSVLVSATPAA
jgi:hypothetical protein